jgi:hypothetical protein
MFSPSFLVVKFIVLCLSLVVLLLRPELAPAVFIVNVLPTIPESVQNGDYGVALVAVILVVVLAFFQWQGAMSLNALFVFFIAYTVWNVTFYFSGHPDAYAAIPQVLVPVLIAAWILVRDRRPERAMWYFALVRCAILIVLVLHAVSPLSCHRNEDKAVSRES